MFGGLRCIDECGVEHFLVFNLTHSFICFLNDPVYRRTSDALLLSVVHLEDLLKTLNMAAGLFEMVQEPLFKFLFLPCLPSSARH